MRYLLRLALYLVIFGFVFSVSYTAVMGVLPVTVTPLKFLKLFENASDYGIKVESQWCPIERISGQMVQAVVASEDNNFMTHSGFDWEAINMAIEYNRRNDKVRGASTISQQTAKNVFCLPARTWTRKAFESYFTVLVELMWSKRRIMEVYLNVLETHPNVYGVEATARRFFDKEAEQLNMHEASLIACVLPSPRRMDIGRPSDYMIRRSAVIRRNMRRLPKVDLDRRSEESEK